MAAKKSSGRTIKCPHCNGTGEIGFDAATVGDMILAARKAKKMTQEKLAAAAGISRTQLTNVEIGRSDTSLRTLQRFADALGVPMRDLIP